MRRRGFFLSVFIIVSALNNIDAQSTYNGIWLGAGVEKQLNRWEFKADAQIRKYNDGNPLKRSGIELTADYKVFNPLHAGVSYELINFYDEKYADYQIRHSIAPYLALKWKPERFGFTWRNAVQYIHKDESDRIRESGAIDEYAVNPLWRFRSKLKATYNVDNFPLDPFAGAEVYYPLNNPDQKKIDQLKLFLGFDYKLSKKHTFNLEYIYRTGLNTESIEKFNVMSISYIYHFQTN